jgi:hypothetical protein
MLQGFKIACKRIDRRPNLLLPLPCPLGIRVEGAHGPTNSRAGGIRLIEGKTRRTDLDPLSFVCLSGENVRFF